MNGVEILSSAEVVVDTCFNWDLFTAFLCGFIVAGVLLGIFFGSICRSWSTFFYTMLIFAFIGIAVGVMGAFSEQIPTKYETHYKVTINDEVSLNEFYEKYEIVKQEGKIYIVREK